MFVGRKQKTLEACFRTTEAGSLTDTDFTARSKAPHALCTLVTVVTFYFKNIQTDCLSSCVCFSPSFFNYVSFSLDVTLQLPTKLKAGSITGPEKWETIPIVFVTVSGIPLS